ncbi:hypothetical protein SAMN05421858_0561 [Haladaptatus litoreus]|uniref:Uncharacterized protein n=1 Tax=Haladaptatus litoreus TaxID=553468 RepID=A0A1N6W0S6_9EURY|nr:hypothetical protein SAMN05421858_0561 [Haladaptatus litoreus]
MHEQATDGDASGGVAECIEVLLHWLSGGDQLWSRALESVVCPFLVHPNFFYNLLCLKIYLLVGHMLR